MHNRKKKKRMHPRSIKYNLHTDEERHPNLRSDQV
jgi:hypothetical protein